MFSQGFDKWLIRYTLQTLGSSLIRRLKQTLHETLIGIGKLLLYQQVRCYYAQVFSI